ncbi:membrane protein insertion efficiency factor YidD [Caulobacter sp. S45]|uniref:membrane protein insertion efficiency factor YidD n=1 Tax=Caulobacter sp. S45 TaxID=1641861 RepID=UPI00131BF449
MAGAYPRLIRAALSVYKAAVSPWLGARCRFMPTCSEYAAAVLISHGPVRGGWLAARRVCRCHPFGGEGYDPPPEPVDKAERARTRLKCEA